jgi:hypothetical protein
LVEVHYPLEFPPDSGAILVLRIEVNCQPATPCIAALVDPVSERRQLRTTYSSPSLIQAKTVIREGQVLP